MGLSHEQNKETKVQCRCFLFVCQEDQQEVGHEAAPLITTRGLSLPVSYLRCHSHTCVRVASAVFSQKIAESWENLFSRGEKNVSASHPGSRGTRSPHSVQSADDDRNVQAQEPSTENPTPSPDSCRPPSCHPSTGDAEVRASVGDVSLRYKVDHECRLQGVERWKE